MTERQANWKGMNWCRKDLRLAIGLRDGMACMWCGRDLGGDSRLTLDHLTPHNDGGGNGADNLIAACETCNSSRGDRPVEEFAEAVAAYLDHDVRAADIVAAIYEHAATDIRPYRAEAKAIMARRPQWQAALEAARAAVEE